MTGLIFRRSDREILSQAEVHPRFRGKVSGAARNYDEAERIVRKYDRRSEGGMALDPLVVTDPAENDRVAIEGHNRAGIDGERLVMEQRLTGRRRVFYRI